MILLPVLSVLCPITGIINRRAILRLADKVSKMQALDNEQLRIENLRLREENEELISENRRLNTKLDQMRVFFQEALRNAPDSIN